MGVLNIRELLQFPDGDNSTDTVINNVHFNKTALDRFNYGFFSNNTISNGSNCYLIFDQYQPTLLSNGSWVNGTTCYTPYYRMGTRGAAGIAIAALFGLSIVLTLINLRKHGRLFLREDKRFRVIGRRWQWYWMLFVAACAMISCVTGIDVDRDYLQSTAIILQSLFYSLMLPGTLAMVWEAVRHWGSWQERQVVDPDPFHLPQDDKRGKTEFYLPLVFYLFTWMHFFMVIPRPWSPLEMQRSEWQQAMVAEPSGTDNRLKAGSVLAVIAWAITCYSLWHSLHHYKPRQSGLLNKVAGFFRQCPPKLWLALIVLAIRLGYNIASSWLWNISIFKYDVNPGWPFGLGYGSTLVILLIFEIAGAVEPNEDRALIEQRRQRGQAADAGLGLTRKPNWWSKAKGDTHLSDEARLRNLTAEFDGGRPTARNNAVGYEMGNLPAVRNRSSLTPATEEREVGNPFRDPSPLPSDRRPMMGRAPSDSAISTFTAASGTTAVSDETLAGPGRQQRIRSMLDI